MPLPYLVIFLSLISLALSACSEVVSGPYDQVEACTERGVVFYQATGNYPSLKEAPYTGRLAEDVAREKCFKNLQAFR
ncbi:hypothetical protein SAMN05421831_10677 [Allopseudospirillum japonicum]|uniref:Uncharacterized protein n=1 Tax=Allopseudospirillum japonicum TaxID=64971 RepID=A0A1H6S9L7_9GAMM|nr:hypothetical protein [Allopseudospirillum japonicum]SEI64569.1 hypothetical protein SAMN05421831_10677 [Allopseudospirillum japonicum]